jgi:hypothetical protein
MPTQLSAVAIEQLQKLYGSGHWTWLYELVVSESEQTGLRHLFRLTPWGSELVVDGETYYPGNITHDKFHADAAGNIPTIEVQVANHDRTAGRYIEFGHGFGGRLLSIHAVNVESIGTTGKILTWTGLVKSSALQDGIDTDPMVQISAESVNPNMVEIPHQFYAATRCRHIYAMRGSRYRGRCGFVVDAGTPAPLRTCPRTIVACEERGAYEETQGRPRNHPARWGGFTGVVTERVST